MYSSIVSICLWRNRTGTLSRRPKAVARRSGIQTLTTVCRRTASTTNRQRIPLTREGAPARRDPAVHRGPPPPRLDHEQAEDPVDEGERAGDFFGRLTLSEEFAEQRCFLRKLGEQIGRKADQAAPDDPADALIVAGREVPPPTDQDREGADADRKADQQHGSLPDFGRIAEDGRHAGERHTQEHYRQSRQGALDRPPSPFGAIDRRSQRKHEKPRIGGGLH